MGDNLAQELYRAYCNAADLVAGSGDVPNWASMPAAQREVWEHVAAKARNEMAKRFAADIETVREPLDVLRARWGR